MPDAVRHRHAMLSLSDHEHGKSRNDGRAAHVREEEHPHPA